MLFLRAQVHKIRPMFALQKKLAKPYIDVETTVPLTSWTATTQRERLEAATGRTEAPNAPVFVKRQDCMMTIGWLFLCSEDWLRDEWYERVKVRPEITGIFL